MNRQKQSVEQAAERPNINPVAGGRFLTREKVFKTVGKTVDFGVDATEFALETTAYTSGRLVRAIGTSTKSAFQGLLGQKYRHAA